jgi:hypothetical protein
LAADAGEGLEPVVWVEKNERSQSIQLKLIKTTNHGLINLTHSLEIADAFALEVDPSGEWIACFRKFRGSSPETCQIFQVTETALIPFQQFLGGTSNIASGNGWMVISGDGQVYRFQNQVKHTLEGGSLRDTWIGEPKGLKALRIRTDAYPDLENKQVNISLMDVDKGQWEKNMEVVLPLQVSVLMDENGQLWKIWLDDAATPQLEKLSWNP